MYSHLISSPSVAPVGVVIALVIAEDRRCEARLRCRTWSPGLNLPNLARVDLSRCTAPASSEFAAAAETIVEDDHACGPHRHADEDSERQVPVVPLVVVAARLARLLHQHVHEGDERRGEEECARSEEHQPRHAGTLPGVVEGAEGRSGPVAQRAHAAGDSDAENGEHEREGEAEECLQPDLLGVPAQCVHLDVVDSALGVGDLDGGVPDAFLRKSLQEINDALVFSPIRESLTPSAALLSSADGGPTKKIASA